jgi:hypothetical protein
MSLSQLNAPIRFDDSSDEDYSDDDVGVITKRVGELPRPTRLDTLKRDNQRNLTSSNIINLDSDSSDDDDDNEENINAPLRLDDDDDDSIESQDEEEPVIPPRVYDCGICFERFLVDTEDKAAAPDITLFGAPLPCEHAFCDDCLREHTWTKLRSTDRNHIVRCPIPNCNQLITNEIAERVLRYDQFGEWTRRQVLASIENKVSHNLQCVYVDSLAA